MRRLGLISTALLLLLTLPAFAQRGGHGGGFGSLGGGFHGGSVGTSRSYSGVSAFGAVGVRPSGVPAFGAVGVRPYFNGNMRTPDFNQGAFHRGAGHPWPYGPSRRRRFAPGYGYGYGYGYGAYLWPNLVGYPIGFGDFDEDDMDDASAVQQGAYPDPPSPGPSPGEAPPGEDYDQPPPAGVPYAGADANFPYAGAYSEVPYAGAHSEEAPPPPAGAAVDVYRPPYQGSSPAPSRSEQQPIRPQPATTIVFSNGWPSMKVHNYVVTKTTFYDLDDGKQREIPLGEIDVTATKKANRSAGVNFAPPIT